MALALVAILIITPGQAAQAARDLAPPALEAAARRFVHQQHGVPPGRLDVLSQATATYATLDREGVTFKLQDRRSGQLYTVLLGRDGQPWDRNAIEGQQRAAHDARYGRLDAAVFERLRQTRDDEDLQVIAWLRTDDTPVPTGGADGELDDDQTEAYFARRAMRRSGGIAATRAALEPRLANWGGTATYDAQLPLMHARLSARGVRAMATWPELDRVYLPERPRSQLDIARNTTGAKALRDIHGLTGEGVKVAVIESEGGRIAANHPHLPGFLQDEGGVCSSPGDHVTHVAGIIGSTLTPHLGIAPGAELRVGGSCSRSTVQLIDASTRASQWGANVINLSWGSQNNGKTGSIDRVYDELVYNSRHTVVAAAGNILVNCPLGTGDHVMSPASAYNVIAVGRQNDLNTVASNDDVMSGLSACDDPVSVHGDRQKPEITAPGGDILSLRHVSPFGVVSNSGTSMSSPMVAGTAALLMESNPALLQRPEAIKAILMASATQNLEGATRLSEYDGAGGMRPFNAHQVATNAGNLRFHQRGSIACTRAVTDNIKEFANVILFAGQRVRIALVWSTDPALTTYSLSAPGQPHADLDLFVHQISNGAMLVRSISLDNTYEIVDFTAPTSGEYSFRRSITCPANSLTPYAVAVFGF